VAAVGLRPSLLRASFASWLRRAKQKPTNFSRSQATPSEYAEVPPGENLIALRLRAAGRLAHEMGPGMHHEPEQSVRALGGEGAFPVDHIRQGKHAIALACFVEVGPDADIQTSANNERDLAVPVRVSAPRDVGHVPGEEERSLVASPAVGPIHQCNVRVSHELPAVGVAIVSLPAWLPDAVQDVCFGLDACRKRLDQA